MGLNFVTKVVSDCHVRLQSLSVSSEIAEYHSWVDIRSAQQCEGNRFMSRQADRLSCLRSLWLFLITFSKMQAQYIELGHNQLLPQFSHDPLIIQILDPMFSKLLTVISNNKQNVLPYSQGTVWQKCNHQHFFPQRLQHLQARPGEVFNFIATCKFSIGNN